MTFAALFFATLAAPATGPADAAGPEPMLGTPTQLTQSAEFAKAGEAYFSPDMSRVIFQAVPTGSSDEHYQMYVADLTLGGSPALSGVRRLTPEGSNNTCGWFLADGALMYATTGDAEDDTAPGGYQREGSDYEWAFPPTMEIVVHGGGGLTDNAAYDAEAATTPDGSRIVFTSTRDGDPDLYVMNADGSDVRQLTDEPGYDGGAFVSPDGERVVWRADREAEDLLQIYVADFDGEKLDNVRRITEGRDVNWAPYWHPDGGLIFYTTSRHGHRNYEVHVMNADGTGDRRVTHAAGFDGLPVVSPDGAWLLWTSQRGDGTSQLFVAPLTVDEEVDEADD